MNEHIIAPVDRNEKIWSYTYSGKTIHAFVQQADGDHNELRAMCRSNVTIGMALQQSMQGKDGNEAWLCKSCMKKAEAMWNRAEASMMPATEAHDLGGVAVAKVEEVQDEVVITLAPVGETTPVIIAADEIQAIWIRAERQQQRRMDALHAEALAMDVDDVAVLEALNSPTVMDALHAEALAMDREWDKSPAGYAHHYNLGPDAVRQLSTEVMAAQLAVYADMGAAAADADESFQGLDAALSPAMPSMNRQQRRAADRAARRARKPRR